MKSKKILAVLMAAGMTLSLAACGSDKKSEDKKVEVTKAEDLKDLTIGVQQGTTGDLESSKMPVQKSSEEAMSNSTFRTARASRLTVLQSQITS